MVILTELIPLFCTLGGAIIGGIFTYVISKQQRQISILQLEAMVQQHQDQMNLMMEDLSLSKNDVLRVEFVRFVNLAAEILRRRNLEVPLSERKIQALRDLWATMDKNSEILFDSAELQRLTRGITHYLRSLDRFSPDTDKDELEKERIALIKDLQHLRDRIFTARIVA